jgi:GGDEF domain-containing protein
MISIRASISELERCEQLRRLVQECYLSAIQNFSQYAVELEESITGELRHHLTALAREAETCSPEEISETRATLRAVLRDYRDKANAYLGQLREELSQTANGLQRVVESLTENDGDHETKLRRALGCLRSLAEDPRAAAIAPLIRASGDAIEQAIADFRQQNQLTVSQLLAEINLLHKRIDALESAVSTDSLTKLFNRSEIESRIRSAQSGGSLLLLSVQGLDRAATQFSSDVSQQLAAAFVKRLRKNLLPEAILGWWSKEGFLVIHPASMNEAKIAAKWVTQHLSGSYACLQGGKTVRPSVQVKVSVLEFTPGEGAANTLEQVGEYFK